MCEPTFRRPNGRFGRGYGTIESQASMPWSSKKNEMKYADSRRELAGMGFDWNKHKDGAKNLEY